MGVPKFFRYISERYPCLSELAREQNIPEFDNLYLDMNGIIHTCSHPDDNDVHFNITEETMFKDIFNYIDKLFYIIKPQKLFFMAVDGVAPRAKMNQQRSRRFRAAKDALEMEQKAVTRGETLKHERFDSNCITPGTEFMVRLHDALRQNIKRKIANDPLWQKCRIILSGHNSPGEGEHKIMDYIRYLKGTPDYDPNTKHCLYGLDADLIILGLCTHELNFVVLREEVKFSKKTKRSSVEETRFFLLHLRLMREYLELEFDALRRDNPDFDIIKLIDDWVLMSFLVGNDFVPHLPCLHISTNALPLLYQTYIKVYPKLGGNINDNGRLNLARLSTYLAELALVERDLFNENYADLKLFDGIGTKNGVNAAFDFDAEDILQGNTDDDLQALVDSSNQILDDDNESMDEDQHMAEEFESHKRNYYTSKLHETEVSSQLKKEIAVHYITALQWILDYYYRGVQSWGWYYPYHYAPFISDLKDFTELNIKFIEGKPFLPFEQLLAVLPAASKKLLPEAYHNLMTDGELIDFYPTAFELDLNGKQHDWEAIVLIPFIDEKVLLSAMKKCESKLSPDEIKRNTHGPMLQYEVIAEDQKNPKGTTESMEVVEQVKWASDFGSTPESLKRSAVSNTKEAVLFRGFPSMKNLDFGFCIKMARVKVFEMWSRKESIVLEPKNRPGMNELDTVANRFLNQVVLIGWPHLVRAKAVAVCNKQKIIDADGPKAMDKKTFENHVRTTQEHLVSRMGIEFDDFSVMVLLRTYIGETYDCNNQGQLTVREEWDKTIVAYPAQGVLSELAISYPTKLSFNKIENLFPTNSTVFFLGCPYYGSEGIILNPQLFYECGRLKVNITALPEPDLNEAKAIQANSEQEYMNTFEACAQLSINPKCFGNITGTCFIYTGNYVQSVPNNAEKINIGLQLKFPKQQEERVGYARRNQNQWCYSPKAIALIRDYHEKFPEVFVFLSTVSERKDFYFESDLYPNNVDEGRVKAIGEWLMAQDHNNANRCPLGSKTLEKDSFECILSSIEHLKTLPVKTVKLQVKPHLLLKPDVSLVEMYKPKRSTKLFDRIVVVKTTYMIPVGSKGTVIGIRTMVDPNPVRLECVNVSDNVLEVLFDTQIPNTNDLHGLANERVYTVMESSVLVIFNTDNAESKRQAANFQETSATSGLSNSVPVNKNARSSGKREKAVKKDQKNIQIQAREPTQERQQKAGAEFWMPTATKAANLPIDQQSKPTSVNPVQISIPPAAEITCQTQLLKSILGLSQPPNGTSAQIRPQIFTNQQMLKQSSSAGQSMPGMGPSTHLYQNDVTSQHNPVDENFFREGGRNRKATGEPQIKPRPQIAQNSKSPGNGFIMQQTTEKLAAMQVKSSNHRGKTPRVPKIAAKFDFNH